MAAVNRDVESEILSQYRHRVLAERYPNQHQCYTDEKSEQPSLLYGGLRQKERERKVGGDSEPPEDDDEQKRVSITSPRGIGGTFDP